MFTIDDRLKGLPAARDQVIALFQSINSPHLAIPGKQAGPAQAYILGVRAPSGFGVFVYLYLADSADCGVYTPRRRALTVEEYSQVEAEAQAFVESMGFMMDNLNFRALPAEQQESLIKTLPVFQKEPRMAQARIGSSAKLSPQLALGRLLSSF